MKRNQIIRIHWVFSFLLMCGLALSGCSKATLSALIDSIGGTSISIVATASVQVDVLTTTPISFSVSPESASQNVTITSNDPQTVLVESNQIIALKPGTVKLKLQSVAYPSVSKNVTVVVSTTAAYSQLLQNSTLVPTSLVVSPTAASVKEGQTTTFSISILPETATQGVGIDSESPETAVGVGTTIYGVHAGTTSLKVYSMASPNVSATILVTVLANSTSTHPSQFPTHNVAIADINFPTTLNAGDSFTITQDVSEYSFQDLSGVSIVNNSITADGKDTTWSFRIVSRLNPSIDKTIQGSGHIVSDENLERAIRGSAIGEGRLPLEIKNLELGLFNSRSFLVDQTSTATSDGPKQLDFKGISKLQKLEKLTVTLTDLIFHESPANWITPHADELTDLPALKSVVFLSDWKQGTAARQIRENVISALPRGLESMSFEGSLSDNLGTTLSQFKDLKTLNIEWYTGDSIGFLDHNVNLESLTVKYVRPIDNVPSHLTGFSSASKLTKLKKLTLWDYHPGLSNTDPIDSLPSLTDLTLTSTQIIDAVFTTMQSKTSLKSIVLGFNSRGDINFNVSVLSDYPSLEYLSFDGANTLTQIEALKNIPKLKTLKIRRGMVDDATVLDATVNELRGKGVTVTFLD